MSDRKSALTGARELLAEDKWTGPYPAPIAPEDKWTGPQPAPLTPPLYSDWPEPIDPLLPPPIYSDWPEPIAPVLPPPIYSDWPEPIKPLPEDKWTGPQPAPLQVSDNAETTQPPVQLPDPVHPVPQVSLEDVLDVPGGFTLTMGPDGEIICGDGPQKAIDHFVEETSPAAFAVKAAAQGLQPIAFDLATIDLPAQNVIDTP
ncbi:MAG: hypothetical protein ACK4PK_03825 [Alphaproteobacteria bacterium]